jgi:hypothetical protein
MDFTRYLAYKGALSTIERAPDIDWHERARLRDTAEALLLASDPEDAEAYRRDAAVALSLLVLQRRWDCMSADALWHEIVDCGPPAPVPTGRPSRAVTFAGAL